MTLYIFLIYNLNMLKFDEALFFDWDKGNIQKNLLKHGVTALECEEAFIDEKGQILMDERHSQGGPHYLFIGKTKKGRLLYEVFTLREGKIRIVSARDLNSRENKLYEKRT